MIHGSGSCSYHYNSNLRVFVVWENRAVLSFLLLSQVLA